MHDDSNHSNDGKFETSLGESILLQELAHERVALGVLRRRGEHLLLPALARGCWPELMQLR